MYCQNNGRPGKPIRLMCGLLILKHLRNLSDECVVEQWSENAYYQYFCGMQEFIPVALCASSEWVHFCNHPKNRKKSLNVDRRLRTIADRSVRKLKRNLGENHDHDHLLELFETILSQGRSSRNILFMSPMLSEIEEMSR